MRRELDRAQEALEHARRLPKHHSKFLLGRSLEMIEDAKGKLNERRKVELGPDATLVLQAIDRLYDAIEGAARGRAAVCRDCFDDLKDDLGWTASLNPGVVLGSPNFAAFMHVVAMRYHGHCVDSRQRMYELGKHYTRKLRDQRTGRLATEGRRVWFETTSRSDASTVLTSFADRIPNIQ